MRTIQMTDLFGPAHSRVFCGFVAVGGDPKTAVVAIRGTAFQTWNGGMTSSGSLVPFTQVSRGGNVAQGFMDIYNTVGTMTPGQQGEHADQPTSPPTSPGRPPAVSRPILILRHCQWW